MSGYQGRVVKPGTAIVVTRLVEPINIMERNDEERVPGFVQSQDGETIYYTEAEDGSGRVHRIPLWCIEITGPNGWTKD